MGALPQRKHKYPIALLEFPKWEILEILNVCYLHTKSSNKYFLDVCKAKRGVLIFLWIVSSVLLSLHLKLKQGSTWNLNTAAWSYSNELQWEKWSRTTILLNFSSFLFFAILLQLKMKYSSKTQKALLSLRGELRRISTYTEKAPYCVSTEWISYIYDILIVDKQQLSQ